MVGQLMCPVVLFLISFASTMRRTMARTGGSLLDDDASSSSSSREEDVRQVAALMDENKKFLDIIAEYEAMSEDAERQLVAQREFAAEQETLISRHDKRNQTNRMLLQLRERTIIALNAQIAAAKSGLSHAMDDAARIEVCSSYRYNIITIVLIILWLMSGSTDGTIGD
jgi:hypothetical protein